MICKAKRDATGYSCRPCGVSWVGDLLPPNCVSSMIEEKHSGCVASLIEAETCPKGPELDPIRGGLMI